MGAKKRVDFGSLLVESFGWIEPGGGARHRMPLGIELFRLDGVYAVLFVNKKRDWQESTSMTSLWLF